MSAAAISQKIQVIRQYRGFSQEELARQLGVSFPTVNAWERGKSNPYPRHQKAIDDMYREVIQDADHRLVLIVEDDESTGLVLSDYVEAALPNWQPMVVNNGYDAVLQIGLMRPGIVLLDIMMPDIDGLKVYERLRAQDELRHTRVIFVTATTDEQLLERARNSGAYGLVHKPLQRQEITEMLKRAVADALA